jgi:PTS system galactitol-specific IIA component
MAELYALEDSASNWEGALRLTADVLLKNGCVQPDFYESCAERERQYPTGFNRTCPVAIPHTTADHVVREAVCVLRLSPAVMFRSIEDAGDVVPVRYVFNLALLDNGAHLELIRRLIISARDPEFFGRLDRLDAAELQNYLLDKLFD